VAGRLAPGIGQDEVNALPHSPQAMALSCRKGAGGSKGQGMGFDKKRMAKSHGWAQ